MDNHVGFVCPGNFRSSCLRRLMPQQLQVDMVQSSSVPIPMLAWLIYGLGMSVVLSAASHMRHFETLAYPTRVETACCSLKLTPSSKEVRQLPFPASWLEEGASPD